MCQYWPWPLPNKSPKQYHKVDPWKTKEGATYLSASSPQLTHSLVDQQLSWLPYQWRGCPASYLSKTSLKSPCQLISWTSSIEPKNEVAAKLKTDVIVAWNDLPIQVAFTQVWQIDRVHYDNPPRKLATWHHLRGWGLTIQDPFLERTTIIFLNYFNQFEFFFPFFFWGPKQIMNNFLELILAIYISKRSEGTCSKSLQLPNICILSGTKWAFRTTQSWY